jgi:NADP-dependent aldehyde dehydrogenase
MAHFESNPTSPSDSTTIESVLAAAALAAPVYAAVPNEARADFLERIADGLEAKGIPLVETAHRETNLPLPRLNGELGRTCGQLRMFAALIRTPDWMDVRIETADPDRKPLPKPDLRRTVVPLGPVAVFGASNFPLAFSVPGGDTASALAAGCPVVAKAHPAHPETSRLAAEAISEAVRESDLPTGVFGLVEGGPEVGRQLVLDERIAAVGFTGSYRVGRLLFDLGAGRKRPIPVFAEMGSVNPVVFLPGVLRERGDALAKGYADSLVLGVGQFCTNPGVVIGLAGPEFDAFLASVAGALAASASAPMLTPDILAGYREGVAARRERGNLQCLAAGEDSSASLFAVDASQFLADPGLREELFGPSAIAVRAESLEGVAAVLDALEGQLTASVHFASEDEASVRQILPNLVRIAGRVIANGFPTGVEVNSAMHHGGPYPATTDARFTSVGTGAIRRFVRPVSLQNFPLELLPPELQ